MPHQIKWQSNMGAPDNLLLGFDYLRGRKGKQQINDTKQGNKGKSFNHINY